MGLNVKGLTVTYPGGHTAVRDFSMRVQPGELVVLAGGTGCGKSTVLSACSGIIPGIFPATVSGRVRLAGLDPWSAGTATTAARAAHLFQNVEPQLFTDRVLDEAMLQAEFGPVAVDTPKEAARHELNRFDLLDRIGERVETLSSGLKQRLALAAMHLSGKDVLLLDEPLSYLDPVSARELVLILDGLRSDGLAVVVAEHRLELLAGVADRVIHMDQDCQVEPRRLGSSPGEEMLRADSLSFAYPGRKVLHKVNLSLHRGECLLLAGPNGSGKTTICHLLAGLIRPGSGQVLLRGASPFSLPAPDRAQRVALVVQNPDRQLYATSVGAEVGPNAMDILTALGLDNLATRHPRSLSYGQKRRLALARAVGRRPDVILVDEPSVGQDAGHLDSLLAVLETYLQQGGALLMATHDRRLASFAHRLLLLNQQRIAPCEAWQAFPAPSDTPLPPEAHA